jgi:gamma-glutamyltranspeptidase/glutathione hydrolase
MTMQNNFISSIHNRLFPYHVLTIKQQYTVMKLTCCLLALMATNSMANTPAEKARKTELPRLWQLVDYHDVSHPVIGRKGMVVSQKRIASEVGADILRQGGNTVDAAVAAGFALSVVLPRAGNLADYKVSEVAPMRGTFRGYEILTMPPPSLGAFTLFKC